MKILYFWGSVPNKHVFLHLENRTALLVFIKMFVTTKSANSAIWKLHLLRYWLFNKLCRSSQTPPVVWHSSPWQSAHLNTPSVHHSGLLASPTWFIGHKHVRRKSSRTVWTCCSVGLFCCSSDPENFSLTRQMNLDWSTCEGSLIPPANCRVKTRYLCPFVAVELMFPSILYWKQITSTSCGQ